MGTEEHFQSSVLKHFFKHFKLCGVLVRFPWQQRTIISIVDKIAKSVSKNKLRKNLFQEKKKTILIFSKFWAKFYFAISKKFLSLLWQLQSTYLCKVLRKNIFFCKRTWFQPNSDFEMKKMGLSVKSFFQGSTNKDSRFQRKILLKKGFSFEKVFFFCYHFWSFSNFFSFCKVV